MSMDKSHYIGFYFKCENRDDVDQEALFPDEDFYRVYDEGGSKEINTYDIYLPNRTCAGCFTLSEDTPTGLRAIVDTNSEGFPPDLIVHGEEVLRTCYEQVALCYGVVSWVS